MLSVFDQCLIDGHRASVAIGSRTLTVISDPNNPANTPDSTTVGTSFVATVVPAADVNLQTALGLDYRYSATADVERDLDPQIEMTARVTDGTTNWKVVHCENNQADPVVRYFLIEVSPKDS